VTLRVINPGQPVTGPYGIPPIVSSHVFTEKPDGICRWFVHCGEPAEVLIAHRTLGSVPTCRSCATKVCEAEGIPLP
jgi:hypothetical protein